MHQIKPLVKTATHTSSYSTYPVNDHERVTIRQIPRREPHVRILPRLIETYTSLVKPGPMMLYLYLTTYADNDKQTCFPSVGKLADKMGVSKPTIRKYLTVLVTHRLIGLETRYDPTGRQTSHLITLLDPSEGCFFVGEGQESLPELGEDFIPLSGGEKSSLELSGCANAEYAGSSPPLSQAVGACTRSTPVRADEVQTEPLDIPSKFPQIELPKPEPEGKQPVGKVKESQPLKGEAAVEWASTGMDEAEQYVASLPEFEQDALRDRLRAGVAERDGVEEWVVVRPLWIAALAFELDEARVGMV